MHVHGNQPYRRLRDHAGVTERPLWRADDPSRGGRVTDVRFRVGRSGRFEWERNGEGYYVQFLPPHMHDMSAPADVMAVEMDYAGVGAAVLQNDHIYGHLAEYFADAGAPLAGTVHRPRASGRAVRLSRHGASRRSRTRFSGSECAASTSR